MTCCSEDEGKFTDVMYDHQKKKAAVGSGKEERKQREIKDAIFDNWQCNLDLGIPLQSIRLFWMNGSNGLSFSSCELGQIQSIVVLNKFMQEQWKHYKSMNECYCFLLFYSLKLFPCFCNILLWSSFWNTSLILLSEVWRQENKYFSTCYGKVNALPYAGVIVAEISWCTVQFTTISMLVCCGYWTGYTRGKFTALLFNFNHLKVRAFSIFKYELVWFAVVTRAEVSCWLWLLPGNGNNRYFCGNAVAHWNKNAAVTI